MPKTWAVLMTTSTLGSLRADDFSLALQELGGLLSGIAAGRLHVLWQLHLHEGGSQALDLLAHGWRGSKASTLAPRRLAVAMACSPATPAPSTSTVLA